VSQALVCSASVEPQRPTFSLAGAGSVLIGFTAAVIAAGTLLGWVVGNLKLGLLIGAVLGLPAGVAATVIKYRNA
jgi:mannose/fructose/N-acetylgalactosamine-specific phosphotransferase system component IIC